MAHQANGDPVTSARGNERDAEDTDDGETSVSEKVRRGIKITEPEPIPGGGKLEQ